MAGRDRRRRGQRGQAIVLIALMMSVLVGFVALAIDSARAFDSRRILQDAVDAGALAGAESYQHGAGWSAAEVNALSQFTVDSRLYGGSACFPAGFAAPTPGGAPVVTSCTLPGGEVTLKITVADNGASGQSFLLSAQRSLTVALMQVLGQSPTINVVAAGLAMAGDQSQTPALLALSSSGCPWSAGSAPLNLSIFSNPINIIGDVVSNGTTYVGAYSYVNLGGDLLDRCGSPTNASHVTYVCWPTLVPAPCSPPNVQGTLRSTSYQLADPGYSAPPAAGGSVGFTSTNVVLAPGIYASDPVLGSASSTCYFLAGGVYEWQAGLTVNQGVVSNELKPPDEPVYNSNTSRSAHQFWNDNGATCGGPTSGTCDETTFTGCSVTLTSGSQPGKGIANGKWSVIVTSIRNVANFRESAPSMCHSLVVGGPDKTLSVTVSNVPGASGYNVYASPPGDPGGCASGKFGLVATTSITNSVTEAQGALGTSTGSWDVTTLTAGWTPDSAAAPDTLKAYPPASETAPWTPSLPNQVPARAVSPAGDRANQNHCATGAGATATCPAASTPGAVAMYLTNNSCFNVKSGGDAHLFSGYQYNWILLYEPKSTTCANTWNGAANTAAIGLSYTPGAGFNSSGSAAFSGYMGGVVASTISITSASNLLIDFDEDYAPAPGGTMLSG